MKRAEIGAVLRFQGELYEVIAAGDAPTLVLAPVHKDPCSKCGCRHHVHVVEESPLFQDNAEPIKTLEGK